MPVLESLRGRLSSFVTEGGDASPFLTDRERAMLLAVAKATIPSGALLPGADQRSIARYEQMMGLLPAAARQGVRGVLWSLQGTALLHHRRPLTSLSAPQIEDLLERWRHRSAPQRMALRLFLLPLKAVHFDDPELFQRLGCVYVPPPANERPPKWTRQVMPASSLPDGEVLEADVIVIGTGAGGAVVARELAARGHAVLMLEEGEHFTRKDFSQSRLETTRQMYRDGGATAAIGNVGIPIPIGRGVGGTTLINSGTCYRTPERVLRTWREELGLSDFTPERMEPIFERVESHLQVAEAKWDHLGGVARVIARGAGKLGYDHRPLWRNAPECDGQGFCCFGCPTDAKRSTNVSYVPIALQNHATLLTGARVTRLLVEAGRAAGVVATCRTEDGGKKRVTARAPHVVIACGTLSTPVLLARNGLGTGSGQLGRNLSIHPATSSLALFDEAIDGWRGIPQGYSIEEFHDEGILFEGAFAPMEMLTMAVPFHGRRFMEVMEAFNRLACFGFMISDTSRGRVRLGPGGKPVITYVLNRKDTERLKRGIAILARVYLAAGATRVFPTVHGFDEITTEADVRRLEAANLRARDFDLSAFHPLGTARMGIDARSSVVGPDHQVHEVPGLYVVDGSAVPSPLGVNPQVTIMALATRAAELLDRRLSRGGS